MIESEEHKADLIQIAEKLRRKMQSFPKDENGQPTEKYLEYISLMFDPDITKIVLEMDVFPKMSSSLKLAKRLGMDKKEMLAKLETTIDRGFILKTGPRIALPMPFFIYDMPFILERNYSSDNVVEFARLSREFFEAGYYKTWETSRKGIPRMRVLTVSEEVEDPKEIVPIEAVYELIDKRNDFAIVPCPCRKRKELEGIRQCKDKYPIHNCLMMGPYAKSVLGMEDSVIREITKEEAKENMRKSAEIGLVLMTDNVTENTNILCSCCECCCGMLQGLTRLDNPRAIAKANFVSTIDPELCVACGTCLDRCKFGAIELEDVAIVDTNKCVGCGLCAVTCPEDAIVMKRMEREQIPN